MLQSLDSECIAALLPPGFSTALIHSVVRSLTLLPVAVLALPAATLIIVVTGLAFTLTVVTLISTAIIAAAVGAPLALLATVLSPSLLLLLLLFTVGFHRWPGS